MFSSVEQAFVGREEIRAPLKTPAWEAIMAFESIAHGADSGPIRARGIIVKYTLLSYH